MEFPHLVEMRQKYGKDGVIAIAVSVDDAKDKEAQARVVKFLESVKATDVINLNLDEESEVWQEKLKIDAVPAAAQRVAAVLGAKEHRVMHLDLRAFGGSALTADVPVPRDRDEAAMAAGIPVTYVPARNTVFLALALAWAEVLESFDIFVGVNFIDYSGYPDCRPEFIAAFERLANLATRAGVENKGQFRVHTPLIQLSKAEIIRLGTS